ncbi:MAG: isoleucine--tRNA ligase [Deltaproteobacteria bacterium]|nr:isoleucine--tRNA ligase [Deltaproteobacteria bacterium]
MAAPSAHPGFRKPEATPDFAALELEQIERWRRHDTFARQVRDGGSGEFVFYDGPPFATGTPHYGHLLAGTLKDIVPRYWAMRGYRVERRFGWDCHGLPVEMEIEKDLGLKSPSEVIAYGVGRYNEACRSIVLRYTSLWRQTVERMGRWVDFDRDYKTMDPPFMESVWWVFRRLWDQGLLYRGHKVMPYSWRLGTPLSNFEAGMDYRKVQDPSVTAAFLVTSDVPWGAGADDPRVFLLAWTTTPWTLPSNMGLCVGPDIAYAVARARSGGPAYIAAASLVGGLLGDHEVLATLSGTELVGLRYRPLFDCFASAAADGAFRVVADGYVVEDQTGIVHTAPAFGEDDHRVALHWGLPMRDPVDAEGRFTGDVASIVGGQVVGLFVKDADKLLVRDLKDRGLLFRQATIDHDYPFCWRSGTPLIYKAMPTWFVRVESVAPGSGARPLRERMAELNAQTCWVPDYVGQKRFGNWIREARDWAISRNRFWGTPLPVWQCVGCGHMECIGSIAELRARAGLEVHDLHKHFVDPIEWPCTQCGAATLQRTPEVLDCWFESGSMPYAQNHYPFKNKELVERNLPAAFIAEGLDQTRGWFYTLLVLSTALFDRPAFQNVIVNGLILAEDGAKMSKRLKNYPDPNAILDSYGADALRALLVTSPAVRAEPMRFSESGVREVVRAVLLPLWNAYSFFATYAVADGWTPPAQPLPLARRQLLDRWVLSALQSVVADVNAEMAQYRLYNVIPRVLGFVDDLTNWYIRRSRRRFWKTDDDADKQAAYETLYEVLTTFSRLLAPILPFFAELLFQRLEARDAADSVHLQRFPQADPAHIDAALEAQMALVRTVARLGRNLRETARINVRQPLRRLTIALQDGAADPWHALMADAVACDMVAEELNVKAVDVSPAGPDQFVQWSARLNFKTAAKRLGAKTKDVAAALAALSTAEVRTAQDAMGRDAAWTVHGESLGRDDVEFRAAPRPGLLTAVEGRVAVALDADLDDELRREGLARELLSRIQSARKEAGFDVQDRIAVRLDTTSAALAAAATAHDGWLRDESLAVRLDCAIVADVLGAIDVAGHEVSMQLQRVVV